MVAKTQLDRIENAILGNGREGLLAQAARMEEAIKTTAERQEEAAASFLIACEGINKLTRTVDSLADTVKSHHASMHFSDLLKKKAFWMILVGGYIGLHLIATYVPSLWDGIVLGVGLPALRIPIP